MNRSAFIALALFLTTPELAVAQSSCVKIADATKRLACYDAANTVSTSVDGNVVDFDDFATDIAMLRGKNVKVPVYIGQAGNLTFGYRGDVFGPFVLLDTSELSRDDRKKLNRDCTVSAGLCGAVVAGKATHQFGQTGIKVTSVAWK